jgi:hypothetical protein
MPASRAGLKRTSPTVVAVLAIAGFCVAATSAFAYRPFDGTDAAVTNPGQMEIELQPVGRLQEGPERFLIAPDIVLSFGVMKNLGQATRRPWDAP